METLVIVNPRLKGEIKDALIEFLYNPVERHMKRRIDELVIANAIAGKYSTSSFHYKGVQYTTEKGIPPRNWNKLLPQFKAQMDEWLSDLADVDLNERPFISGFINQVLNSSNHIVDYYAMLPDSCHQAIKALKFDDSLMYTYSLMPPEKMERILRQNENAIQMMKTRMVTNLLY